MDFDGQWLVWVRRPPGDLPAGPVTGTEVFGLHLEGGRFQVDLEGVTSVWLPWGAAPALIRSLPCSLFEITR